MIKFLFTVNSIMITVARSIFNTTLYIIIWWSGTFSSTTILFMFLQIYWTWICNATSNTVENICKI